MKVILSNFSPPQWEALRYMYIQENNDYSRSFYSYDATNSREKIVQTNSVNGVTDGQEYLRLYSSNLEYVYTASTRKCVKNQLTQKFREFGFQLELHMQVKLIMAQG